MPTARSRLKKRKITSHRFCGREHPFKIQGGVSNSLEVGMWFRHTPPESGPSALARDPQHVPCGGSAVVCEDRAGQAC